MHRQSQPNTAIEQPTIDSACLLRQHLDSLSPFLTALHHQQQLQQQVLLGNLGNAAQQLAIITNLGGNCKGFATMAGENGICGASAPSSGSPEPDLNEEEAAGSRADSGGCAENEAGDELEYCNAAGLNGDCSSGGGEPEDLSLGPKEVNRECLRPENGASLEPPANGWSYEEQFKQLYELSNDPKRKEWLDDWLSFMHKTGKPVTRIPIMAKQVLDLYELYRLVVQHGGLVEIINKKLWREITKGLNLPTSITSAAFTLRSQYTKYLYDYECAKHNLSQLEDLKAAIDANKREGRRNQRSVAGMDDTSSASPASAIAVSRGTRGTRMITEQLEGNNLSGDGTLVVGSLLGDQTQSFQALAPHMLLKGESGGQHRLGNLPNAFATLPFRFPFIPPNSVAAALLGSGLTTPHNPGLSSAVEPADSANGGTTAAGQLDAGSEKLLLREDERAKLELFQKALALDALGCVRVESNTRGIEQNGRGKAASKRRRSATKSESMDGEHATEAKRPSLHIRLRNAEEYSENLLVSIEFNGTMYQGILLAENQRLPQPSPTREAAVRETQTIELSQPDTATAKQQLTHNDVEEPSTLYPSATLSDRIPEQKESDEGNFKD